MYIDIIKLREMTVGPFIIIIIIIVIKPRRDLIRECFPHFDTTKWE